MRYLTDCCSWTGKKLSAVGSYAWNTVGPAHREGVGWGGGIGGLMFALTFMFKVPGMKTETGAIATATTAGIAGYLLRVLTLLRDASQDVELPASVANITVQHEDEETASHSDLSTGDTTASQITFLDEVCKHTGIDSATLLKVLEKYGFPQRDSSIADPDTSESAIKNALTKLMRHQDGWSGFLFHCANTVSVGGMQFGGHYIYTLLLNALDLTDFKFTDYDKLLAMPENITLYLIAPLALWHACVAMNEFQGVRSFSLDNPTHVNLVKRAVIGYMKEGGSRSTADPSTRRLLE